MLLDPQIDLADAIEFPSFVPETMNLLQLLKSLQRQQRGLAIVLDEFGGTAGMVTMEDIFEEMIGKIPRRSRTGRVRDGETRPRAAGASAAPCGWMISGANTRRWEMCPEVETMGGLLMSLLDVVPSPGDSATFRGLKLTAQSADERRVRELLVEVTNDSH